MDDPNIVIEQILQKVEASGTPILDREVKKQWVQNNLNKGFTAEIVLQKLKESNFNFAMAQQALDQEFQKKQVGLVQDVAKLKEKEEGQKKSSQLTWIITSFLIGAVGAFTAYILKSTTSGMDTGGAMGGMGGVTSLLTTIIKAGWIIAIVGGFVGLFLVVMFLASYLKKKAGEKEEGGMEQPKEKVI